MSDIESVAITLAESTISEKLDSLDRKLDQIITLLLPVNAHTDFVDDLKTACQESRILRSIVRVRAPEPVLTIENNLE